MAAALHRSDRIHGVWECWYSYRGGMGFARAAFCRLSRGRAESSACKPNTRVIVHGSGCVALTSHYMRLNPKQLTERYIPKASPNNKRRATNSITAIHHNHSTPTHAIVDRYPEASSNSKMAGFDFSNFARNAALHAKGFPLPKATSTGTTIVGCVFDGGVVIAAGTYIASLCSAVLGGETSNSRMWM